MTHQFLSAAWFEAVDELRAEAPPPPAGVDTSAINITVIEGPNGHTEGHLEGGVLGLGHADSAETTITLPYGVAKSMFVGMNVQVVMEALMAGKIQVDGDMSTLMSLAASTTPTPELRAFTAKLQSITA